MKTTIATLFVLITATACHANRCPRSPDGTYEAIEVSDRGSGLHYQVKEINVGRVLFTTHARYATPNDAKACSFNGTTPPSAFAAAYHYGHDHSTWVGVWSLPDGKFLRTRSFAGFTRDIPDSVFEGDPK